MTRFMQAGTMINKNKYSDVSQSEGAIVDKALTQRRSHGLDTNTSQKKPHHDILVQKKGRNRLVWYSFSLAAKLTLVLVPFASSLVQDSIGYILKETGDLLIGLGLRGCAILFSVLASALYARGYQIAHYRVEEQSRSNTYYLLAAVCTQLATSNSLVYWANMTMYRVSDEQYIPLLIAQNIVVSLIFSGLGVAFQSVRLWFFALWSFANSVGLVSITCLFNDYDFGVRVPEMTGLSGPALFGLVSVTYLMCTHEFAVTMPGVIVCYGAFLLGLAVVLNQYERFRRFVTSTTVMGVFYVFCPLGTLPLPSSTDTSFTTTGGDIFVSLFCFAVQISLVIMFSRSTCR